MSPDEFDRYLEGEPDEANDERRIITPDHITVVMSATHEMFVKAMGSANQLVVTLTRQMPGGPLVWSVTTNGTTIAMDSFEEFVTALGRLSLG